MDGTFHPNLVVRPATIEDYMQVVETPNPATAFDITQVLRRISEKQIVDAYRRILDNADTVLYNGEIAAVFGCIAVDGWLGDTGLVWSMFTPVINEQPMATGRYTRQWIAEQSRLYRRLYGFAYSNDPVTQRWFRFLKFRKIATRDLLGKQADLYERGWADDRTE